MINIKRTSFFYGERKIGLDSNILIKLYEDPYLFDYEEARIFNDKDLIFIHKICLYEFVKYLKKNLEEDKAKSEAKNWLDSHNISIINIYVPEEELKDFEEESNKRFNELNRKDLKCHRPDSIIVLAYKKAGINKVISTDNSFRETAKFLGIDGEKLPSLDNAISKKLRRLQEGKRKFFKRKY